MVCDRGAYTTLKRRLLSGGSVFRWSAAFGISAGMALAAAPAAKAFNLYSGPVAGNDLEVNLNTTVEYSNIFRVNAPSKALTSDINANDGDLAFQHGLVDNTFDVLPVFDLKYGNYGAHVSGEAYLDTPYLGKSQNDSPSTFNAYTVGNRDFTRATRNVNGQNAVLLDAFVYGTQYFGDGGAQSVTVKVGRQTLLWGQSLYFASNGIAAGQAPIDVVKALNLPNAQSQQIFMPVGQIVATYSAGPNFSLQAYYQFEWERDTLEGVGSYFSTSDVVGPGAQRLIVAQPVPPYFGGAYFNRTKDLRPPIDNGEFGVAVQGTVGKYDLGLYALRYDDHAPEGIYIGGPFQTPFGPATPLPSKYWLVYPRDIQVYGASASMVTDSGMQISGEVSGRRNMPLVSVAAPFSSAPGSANAGALYPVGSTVAAQISSIYVTPGIPLDPGGISFSGEAAMNHVVSVQKNQALLEPGRNQTAAAFQFTVSPTYDNLLPNLDLSFPIGFKYNFLGRSMIDTTMNHGTGFFNVGVAATYRTVWNAALTYQDYIGKADPTLNPYADRGYVEFSVQRAF